MRAVQRILAIFESFSVETSSLTLQEISDRIELQNPPVFVLSKASRKPVTWFVLKTRNTACRSGLLDWQGWYAVRLAYEKLRDQF
jgi:hypothetical protein